MSLPKPEYDPDYDVVIRVYHGYDHTDRLLERLKEIHPEHAPDVQTNRVSSTAAHPATNRMPKGVPG